MPNVKTYPESAALVGIATSVWNGNMSSAKIDIAVSDRLKAEFIRLLNKDIQSVFLTDSDVRHIKKKHGQNESARGQGNIKPEDFALIPALLNEFDTAEHTETDAKGNKRILFTKKIGETMYLATIERGNNKVQIRTFWKMPDQVPRAG